MPPKTDIDARISDIDATKNGYTCQKGWKSGERGQRADKHAKAIFFLINTNEVYERIQNE